MVYYQKRFYGLPVKPTCSMLRLGTLPVVKEQKKAPTWLRWEPIYSYIFVIM
jgi:hypothetical protein